MALRKEFRHEAARSCSRSASFRGRHGPAAASRTGSVQQLIAQSAVEAFDKGILHRLTRDDVMPADPLAVSPGQDRCRGQLGAVIGDDRLGVAADRDVVVKLPRHPRA